MEVCTETECCLDYGAICKQKTKGGFAQCRPAIEQCPPPDAVDSFWTCTNLEKATSGPKLGTVEFALLYDNRFGPSMEGSIYEKTPLYQSRHQIMYQQNEMQDFTFLATASNDTTSVLFEFLDWQQYTISATDGRSPNGDQSTPFSAFGKKEAASPDAAGVQFLGAPRWVKELSGCGGDYTLRATPYDVHGEAGLAKHFSIRLLPSCECIDYEPVLRGLEFIALSSDGTPRKPPAASRAPSPKKPSNLRRAQLTDEDDTVAPAQSVRNSVLLKHGFTYVIDTTKTFPGANFTVKATECEASDTSPISKVEWILMDSRRKKIKTSFDETAPYTLMGDVDGENFTPLPEGMVLEGGRFYVRALPYDHEGKPGPKEFAVDIRIDIVSGDGEMAVDEAEPAEAVIELIDEEEPTASPFDADAQTEERSAPQSKEDIRLDEAPLSPW
ncbi:unnamed protein product [Vitrella brassicaformis CCMP3155]|uniref:Uncharacterized protein n=1 Tax=Vitrella brassicaformis (strain CCMP3155) TaxID=1169540 RepID=A0A0G4EIL0_VITBC|nr:unnamed protein product [Vitrella brassicaformis CCMP3155]|eukprot:CEL95722.1 unnamed protein product [Vitrella brassicaformis CCMP3155]